MSERVPTRRALLGFAGLAPIAIATLAAPASAVAADTADWDAAVGRLRVAHAAFEAVCGRLSEVEAAYFREEKRFAPVVAEIRVGDTADAHLERLHAAQAQRADIAELRLRLGMDLRLADETEASARHTAAMEALLATPAPTLDAAIDKLAIAIEYEEPTEPILAELRRLATEVRL